MNIAEARSFDNGLEFYLHEKNITLSITRKPSGEIDISTKNSILPFKREKNSKSTYVITLFLTILFMLIQSVSLHIGIKTILILGIIWISTFCMYYFLYKNPQKTQSYKYHAAEHKVLNYIDKFGKSTEDVSAVMKMSSYSYRCGSTLVSVVYVFVTLILLGIVFIPGIILKILWFAFSVYITLYLWANGKCYFFQKFALIEPTYAEVELATIGLCEYLRLKNNSCC